MGRPKKLVNPEDIKKLEVQMTVEPEPKLDPPDVLKEATESPYETALVKEHVCSETLVSCLTDEDVSIIEDLLVVLKQLYRSSNNVSFRTKIQLSRKTLTIICNKHKQLSR